MAQSPKKQSIADLVAEVVGPDLTSGLEYGPDGMTGLERACKAHDARIEIDGGKIRYTFEDGSAIVEVVGCEWDTQGREPWSFEGDGDQG